MEQARAVASRCLAPRLIVGVLAGGLLVVPPDAQGQSTGTPAACERLQGSTLGDALQGKLPGVNVRLTGGATSGGSIRVRGVNNVGSNDPLIYVDNIRISPYRSGGDRGMHAVPLFEFVDVSQIDRIEVLRGPTATIQYGDGAANGVILIYTKRGARGIGREATQVGACEATSGKP